VSSTCPFGERTDALSACPLGQPCDCILDLLLHSLGFVDAQTVVVAAYWTENTRIDPNLQRRTIPGYRLEGK
jgi:hypothetical protein